MNEIKSLSHFDQKPAQNIKLFLTYTVPVKYYFVLRGQCYYYGLRGEGISEDVSFRENFWAIEYVFSTETDLKY